MPFSDAIWVQADGEHESPQMRGTFTIPGAIAHASIRICGLGYFELWINGARVGDDVLVPAWSDYHRRDMRDLLYPNHDAFRYRTYYLEYDATRYLRPGANAIGAWLGNGWYNQHERNVEGHFAYGAPRLCFLLTGETAGGEAFRYASGPDMLWRPSEIASNNIYMGETHDLSLRRDDWSMPGITTAGWRSVRAVDAPDTHWQRQDCAPDRVVRRIAPRLVHEDGDRRIYDCGENTSGWVVLALPADAGREVVVTYAEELDAARTALDVHSAGGDKQVQTDRYLCADRPMTAHPRFCWHGFRYFQVRGAADVVEAQVVHGDHAITATFDSDNETLNWLFGAYVRSQLTNIHGGVPSDCPHRERLGYTGDGQLAAEAAMLCLDVKDLYRKWMRDIADGQDPKGHVQHTAPFYGGGGGPGGWGGAIWAIPWQYYLQYGDDELLRLYGDGILRWLDYMEDRSEGGLVVREEAGGWCLGEWCAPGKMAIPEPFVNTYYYIKGLCVALEMGGITGADVREAVQRERIARAEAGLTAAYFDAASGSFCGGVNGADAFALDVGLGDERTAANLVGRYRALGAFDTGMFGTDILVDRLFRLGEGDLALRLLTAEGDASFARMRERGATTLWETWDGRSSHNHPMFGGVVRNLFTHILGIQQMPGSAGYARAVVRPAPLRTLGWARGSVETPRGRIAVERNGEGATSVEGEAACTM